MTAMKTLILILLMLTISSAVAKDKDRIVSDSLYLCLNTAAAGLNWSGGKWVEASFHPLGEFQLDIEIDETVFPDGSKHQFIHFTRNGDSGKSHCGMEMTPLLLDDPHCFQFGATITFSKEELRGGISMLLGSTGTGDTRDSLLVIPFTCQRR